MDKVVATAAEAVADITDGSSLAVGGFGFCGIPEALIAALVDTGGRDLKAGANSSSGARGGVGGVELLVGEKVVAGPPASWEAQNGNPARQFLAGCLHLVETAPEVS